MKEPQLRNAESSNIKSYDILMAKRTLVKNGRTVFMSGFCYRVHEITDDYAFFESVNIQVPLSKIEDFFYIEKIIPELCRPRKVP